MYSQIEEKVFQELKLEELNSGDKMSILSDLFDKQLAKDDVTDIFDMFGEFDIFQRKEEQYLNQYMLIFDFKYKKIQRKGLNFSSELIVFRLLKKAYMTRAEELLILTGMDFTNKVSLYEQAKKVLKLLNSCQQKRVDFKR